ncbi:MAG TPA: hypothetical protein VGF01_05300 [Terracidiphilus sp.]|jgi:hypothetical protein
MEADWEFELGVDAGGVAAPVIDAAWSGLVDLRRSPERARELSEVVEFPALAETLIRLNSLDSPVWSCKCDYWARLESDEFDPDEMDALPGHFEYAIGCYIDLIAARDGWWSVPAALEEACRRWCGLLRAVSLRNSRVDLVVRCAILSAERKEFGITAYLSACGATATESARTLQAAFASFADALCDK